MQLEIVKNDVQARTVRSKRDGKEYTFYQQEAFLHVDSSPYPTRCFVPVSGPNAGYNPGRYSLATDALVVDRFGNLALSRKFGLVLDEAE